jgi:hypothetical protein
MTRIASAAAFRLSRVYAQGWNLARTLKGSEQANPYSAEPERGRWQAGFADAQKTAERQPRPTTVSLPRAVEHRR